MNMWFTEENLSRVARLNPSTGAIAEFGLPTGATMPEGIAAGPDGNLWVTLNGANPVCRMTTTGAVTVFPSTNSNTNGSTGPLAGPDGKGNMWFVEDITGESPLERPDGEAEGVMLCQISNAPRAASTCVLEASTTEWRHLNDSS
jgi:virginiamycin B lyase